MGNLSNNNGIANNLIVKSIEAICNYGGFRVERKEKKEYTFRLYIDGNNELCLEMINLKTGMKSFSKNIKSFFAVLAYGTFFCKSGEALEIVPEFVNKSETERLEKANFIYDIYQGMLVKNFDKIGDVIINGNDSVFLDIVLSSNDDNYLFQNTNVLLHNIEVMVCEYSENLIYGLSLYKEMCEAEEDRKEELKDKWDEFTALTNIHTVLVPKAKNDGELKKLEIPYEIINERNYLVDPAIGRSKEIREIGASLLSYAVNPVLLGEPGVGKTVIIEGLAYRIKNGKVPDKLKNKKILKISPAALVSGCIYRGSFEERMQKLVEFLKDNDEYILYIDEIHTALGTGSSMSSNNDVLNILKPYIENGDIKIIGATTSAEYEEILLKDKAFARRFKPVIVKEPTDIMLKIIIENNISKYEKICGIPFVINNNLKSIIVDILINVTGEKNRTYKEKRYNPALVLSIIEQAFGYAVYDQSKCVSIDYVIEALCNCENIYETSRNDAISHLKAMGNISIIKPKIIELRPL